MGSLSLFPGDLPNPGIEPASPVLQADSLPSEPPRKSEVFINKIEKRQNIPGFLWKYFVFFLPFSELIKINGP